MVFLPPSQDSFTSIKEVSFGKAEETRVPREKHQISRSSIISNTIGIQT